MLSQLNATLEEENKALVDQVNKLVEQVCDQANKLTRRVQSMLARALRPGVELHTCTIKCAMSFRMCCLGVTRCPLTSEYSIYYCSVRILVNGERQGDSF